MGKDLKGKELGKGLGQRKEDGLYYARCRNYRGERRERCFKTLPEAKIGGKNSSIYAYTPKAEL